MGGNTFKDLSGNSLTTRISINNVNDTLDSFFSKILLPSGVGSYCKIGSTGKKDFSGDLDIAVGPFSSCDKKTKEELFSRIKSNLHKYCDSDCPGSVRDEQCNKLMIVGQNIAVMYPISNREEEFVQIDVMLSKNLVHTSWLMHGTGFGVKGVYRNMLLSYVAKLLSNTEGKKITISFPGGIQVVENGKVIVEKTEDPEIILSLLRITGRPSETLTFEGLVTILTNTRNVSDELEGYQEYIRSHTNDMKKSEDAMRAVSFLSSRLRNE